MAASGQSHAYAADEVLASAVLLRLAEIIRFDHTERVSVEGAALPCTVVTRSQAGMMPCDRRAVGFVEPSGPTPGGLTRRLGDRYLSPVEGSGGQAWAGLLARWNERPALAPVLGEHGLPSMTTAPDTGAVTVPVVLVVSTSDELRAAAPVLLRYTGAPPPDLTHLLPFDGDEFARIAHATRQAAMHRLRS